MSALDDNPQGDSRPTGIGPGERLQAARIQKGLSLDDVADRMHLSTSILEAIEENNFEEITAPIFVKGYLRAYARIVSLDEDDMIQQYVEYYSEEDPPISSTSNMAPELSVTDARIKWTTYLVVLVLVALLGAWWWNKEKSDESPISLDSQSTEDARQDETVAEVSSSAIEAVSESDSDVAPTQVEPEPQPEPDTAVMPESSPVVPDSNDVEESAVEEVAIAEDAGESVVVEAPEQAESDEATLATDASETTSSPEPSSLIAPSGSDRLQIIVHADTWADIKDSSDYQMVYDLLRADQTVELVGAAPFSVFLGNGHGVEIRLNDEEFSFGNRVRDDNTARLKIGG